MSDIADLLDASVLNHHNDDDVDLELISNSLVNNLRDYPLQHERTTNDHDRWQIEEHCLKFGKIEAEIRRRTQHPLGSKQLSPSDYLTRKSLYNRPVAFEKDSRTWARSLLDNFQKPDPHCPSASSPLDFTYYLPMIKRSSSFDHHVQYIEHLNECNDYPAYLEYLRENRSQLFLTLTDSIDVIDGLIGTAVSSY